MTIKKIINTANAPAPIGPYSQAILAGETLYISGQIALDAATGDLQNNSIKEETEKVISNLRAILDAAGMDFSNVIKTSIFLSSMDLFSQVNEIYGAIFTKDFPARETIAALGLPKNVNVEISMIAVK